MCGTQSLQVAARLLIIVEDAQLVWYLMYLLMFSVFDADEIKPASLGINNPCTVFVCRNERLMDVCVSMCYLG